MTPQRMMERLFPADHAYKLALYPTVVTPEQYTTDGEWVGYGYAAGGKVLTGRRIDMDADEAVLRFDDVTWVDADIQVRTVIVYDATTGDVINTTHMERVVGVYAGLFEYAHADEGVFRLG